MILPLQQFPKVQFPWSHRPRLPRMLASQVILEMQDGFEYVSWHKWCLINLVPKILWLVIKPKTPHTWCTNRKPSISSPFPYHSNSKISCTINILRCTLGSQCYIQRYQAWKYRMNQQVLSFYAINCALSPPFWQMDLKEELGLRTRHLSSKCILISLWYSQVLQGHKVVSDCVWLKDIPHVPVPQNCGKMTYSLWYENFMIMMGI